MGVLSEMEFQKLNPFSTNVPLGKNQLAGFY